ncbi:glycosyltransferase family 2 protein [Microbacterium elymi]|uniref:Glycosyltransferase n=1 Tax=Microbacterium elymi TaxID=2909587 RepID=A0ABY5NKT0_9MICO|nr:glycosyltransferase [Microbacterium elymi]UUT35739.1 glycosyltransferase [Microbacterium elymi]
MILLSAVIPLYRVEKYLPDLLGSLSAQKPGGYRLEVIFVDDGSPDRSGAMAQEWLERSGIDGRVIRQDNAGVSAARNAGLRAARGEWVTFPDSDDYVAPDFFRRVSRFLARHGERVTIASTRLVRLREPDPKIRDVHALKFRFMAGDRGVPMATNPDFFQLNVASAFFRRRDILDRGLLFRSGLHASEDALFVAEFLLDIPDPVLGLVADARYVYRKRASGDSAVDRFRSDPDTYIERFRDGYRGILERAAARGAVPGWLQSMFLYECQWILPPQLTSEGYAAVLDDAGRAAALDALAACARHVTEQRLFEYDATALPMESRLLLQRLAGRSIPAWVGAYRDSRDVVTIPVADPAAVELHGPHDEILVVEPVVSTPDYFGQRLLHRWEASAPAARWAFADAEYRSIVERTSGDTGAQAGPPSSSTVRSAPPGRAGPRRRGPGVEAGAGPGGSLWRRLVWEAQLTRHRAVRLIRRLLRR